MRKAVFLFFFLLGLVLLYLTVVLEQQLILIGMCPK